MKQIYIGTAGTTQAFLDSEYNKDAPLWVKSIGLNAYEFQATHGVNTKQERANSLRDSAAKSGVKMSIHAPYYIVLSSEKEDVRKRSVHMLADAVNLAEQMGATNVVFHPGTGSTDRKLAMKRCIEGLEQAVELTKGSGVIISPETGGKKAALGSLEELIEMDKVDRRIQLCVDFAHHHARTGGSLKTAKDFERIIDEVEKELGKESAERLHCHFSSLEFTDKGEKNHVSAYEKGNGPDYVDFCECIASKSMKPTVICESSGTQDAMGLMIKKEIERLTK